MTRATDKVTKRMHKATRRVQKEERLVDMERRLVDMERRLADMERRTKLNEQMHTGLWVGAHRRITTIETRLAGHHDVVYKRLKPLRVPKGLATKSRKHRKC
jgi:hypothetical protein